MEIELEGALVPKRSDDFQKIVHYIYDKTDGADATVEESAELPEPSCDSLREIDILITRNPNDQASRKGVECRDWRNAQDIQWIDELIGKYADLRDEYGISKVTAVSSSGFTKPAAKKAEAHSIDVQTLEAVVDIQQGNEFASLMIAEVELTYSLVGVRLVHPGISNENPDQHARVYNDGKARGKLDGFVNHLFTTLVEPEVRQWLKVDYPKANKTMADAEATVVRCFSIVVEGVSLLDGDGSELPIARVDMAIQVKPIVSDLAVERSRLGSALITSGVTDVNGTPIRINTAQVSGLKEGFYTVEGKKNARPLKGRKGRRSKNG